MEIVLVLLFVFLAIIIFGLFLGYELDFGGFIFSIILIILVGLGLNCLANHDIEGQNNGVVVVTTHEKIINNVK